MFVRRVLWYFFWQRTPSHGLVIDQLCLIEKDCVINRRMCLFNMMYKNGGNCCCKQINLRPMFDWTVLTDES